jgi:hypothetical protein
MWIVLLLLKGSFTASRCRLPVVLATFLPGWAARALPRCLATGGGEETAVVVLTTVVVLQVTEVDVVDVAGDVLRWGSWACAFFIMGLFTNGLFLPILRLVFC